MSKIFLSHSHRDNASAIAIGQWLSENGWNDFFLDISPDRGLAPGERWQEALKQAAHRCEAVLFLISPDWLNSRWCLAEFLLAKQLGKTIFGLLIRPMPIEALPAEMRNEWQLCDLVTGVEKDTITVRLEASGEEVSVAFSNSGLRALKSGIARAGLDPSTFPWPPSTDPERAPYRGLAALDGPDAAIYFGRETEVTLALDMLRRLHESSTDRLFVILGASGSGKSSFLRAGLLPRLSRDDRNFFVMRNVRPERAVILGPNGLMASLDAAFRAARRPVNRSELRRSLDDPEAFATLIGSLHRAVDERFVIGNARRPSIVLAIDQAEEIFSAEQRGEAGTFLKLIQQLLVRDHESRLGVDVFVLMSIRSDSYERLQTEPLLSSATPQVFSLPPMPREEYKVIIEGPAARHQAAGHRLRVDPRLTTQLLLDTQGADALPLLAFTLERLLLEHGADGELSVEDYRQLGGVEGSIDAAVRAALESPEREPVIPVAENEQNRILRSAFIPWLAHVDAQTEERKRRVASWEELPVESHAIIERLINQRLLTRDRRRVQGASVDTVVVEVAHEALLRRWPLLTLWLDEDADVLKAIDAAKRAAAEWEKNGRRDAWLNHANERLSTLESLLSRTDLDQLLGDGRAYVRACRKREDELAAQAVAIANERQQNERLVRDAQQAIELERLRNVESTAAHATERAAAAKRLSRRTTVGAAIAVVFMLIAIWSAVSARQQQRAAEHALGVQNVAEASRKLEAGLASEALAHLAEAVRLRPDEAVWRASLINTLISQPWSRVAVEVSASTNDAVAATSFSPDGKVMLVAIGDEATLWDVTTSERIGTRMRHRNVIRTGAFSPEGALVVTGSRDRTMRIWDARTGQPRTGPISHDSALQRVAFSADGKRVVSFDGNLVRVFDRNGVDSGLTGSRVSPSGNFIIAAKAGEQIAHLWQISPRRHIGSVLKPDYGGSVLFSRDESVIALIGDSRLQIMNTATGESNAWRLDGYSGSLAFAADGAHLAVESSGNIVVFDARSRHTVGEVIAAGVDLSSMQVSADGSRVLTVNPLRSDRPAATIRLWDVATGRQIIIDDGKNEEGTAAMCANSTVAIARGNTVTLWDGKTGTRLGAPIAHGGLVEKLRLSADCRFGASVASREVRIWTTATGAPVAVPLAHTSNVTEAVFSPTADRILTTTSAGVRVWDLRTGSAAPEALRHARDYKLIGFSGDGRRAVTADEAVLRTWDAQTGDPVGAQIKPGAKQTSIVLDSTGSRVLISDGFNVSFYRTDSGDRLGRVWRISENDYYPAELLPAISPDWKQIVTVLGKAARIWNIDTADRRGKLLSHRLPITAVEFSRDGRLIVTGSQDATARVWSAASGEPVGVPMRHAQTVRRAMFNATGTRIVTVFEQVIREETQSVGYPRQVRVWDAGSGEAIGPAIVHDYDVTALAISPDGTRVLTGSNNRIQLWDPITGARVANALDFGTPIRSVEYSTDGKRIIISATNQVSVRDADQLIEIGRPLTSVRPVACARLVPGEHRIMIVSDDPTKTDDDKTPQGAPWSCLSGAGGRTASLWDVPTASPADAAVLGTLAGIFGGYKISPLGAIEPVAGRAKAAKALQPEAARGAAGLLTQWLLADPASRAPSPYSTTRAKEQASK